MHLSVFTKNRKVIHKNFNNFFNKIRKDAYHTSLERTWCIAESEGHAAISKCPKGTSEGRLFLILMRYGNLIVTGVSIKEAIVIMAC